MRGTFFLKVIFLLMILTYCRNDSSEKEYIPDMVKLKSLASDAKLFCNRNNFNTDFYLLIDMSIHSGLKRFFIWDMEGDSISYSFMVSHGCGDNPWGRDLSKEKAVTSNIDGSHCSSIGKYKVGTRGYSNWGININYVLHGLESTNNNAFNRQIVLHSWEMVKDSETYPSGTPEGWGCPAISNNSMRILDTKLRNSEKKVLLWIVQ